MTEDEYEQSVINVLISTHPGWHYEQRDLPGLPRWWATRYYPLRPDQRKAGARDVLGRTSLHRLVSALARHDKILHNLRY